MDIDIIKIILQNKKNAQLIKKVWTFKKMCIIKLTDGDGQVAQLVEQRTENPRVGGSIPSLTTNEKPQIFLGFFLI